MKYSPRIIALHPVFSERLVDRWHGNREQLA